MSSYSKPEEELCSNINRDFDGETFAIIRFKPKELIMVKDNPIITNDKDFDGDFDGETFNII